MLLFFYEGWGYVLVDHCFDSAFKGLERAYSPCIRAWAYRSGFSFFLLLSGTAWKLRLIESKSLCDNHKSSLMPFFWRSAAALRISLMERFIERKSVEMRVDATLYVLIFFYSGFPVPIDKLNSGDFYLLHFYFKAALATLLCTLNSKKWNYRYRLLLMRIRYLHWKRLFIFISSVI